PVAERLGNDHARANGAVGEPINDDECAGGAVLCVTIQSDGRVQADPHLTDLVELQAARRPLLQGVHIYRVVDTCDGTRHIAGRTLDVVFLARQHRLFAHPYQHRVEAVGNARQVVGMHQHVATGDVDLVFQGQRDGFALRGLLQLAVQGDDALDAAALARRHDSDLIALAHDTAGQSAGKTSEVQVWRVDILYR